MKIKWNWGTKLFIATAMFMLFLLGMVYMTTLQDRSMVEDEYYQKSMVYQLMMDKKNNTKKLEQKVQVNMGREYLSIRFQDFFNPANISGEIKIYRPSDIKLDVLIPIKLDSTRSLHFPTNKLTKGKYIVKIDYKVGETGYYQEQVVFVE